MKRKAISAIITLLLLSGAVWLALNRHFPSGGDDVAINGAELPQSLPAQQSMNVPGIHTDLGPPALGTTTDNLAIPSSHGHGLVIREIPITPDQTTDFESLKDRMSRYEAARGDSAERREIADDLKQRGDAATATLLTNLKQ